MECAGAGPALYCVGDFEAMTGDLFLTWGMLLGVVIAAAVLAALWGLFVFLRRQGTNLVRTKSASNTARYRLVGRTLTFNELDKLLTSLEKQLSRQGVDYILGLDEGGFIVGRLLALRLSTRSDKLIPCTKVGFNVADTKDGVQAFPVAKELDDQSDKAYIGKRNQSHIAILADFDPDNLMSDRVSDVVKGVFAGRHTYQRTLLCITKDQQRKLTRKRRPGELPLDRVVWAVRVESRRMKLPW
jgi:hypothetical protein